MGIKPLEDRIVVKQASAEQTTASGLVIPDCERWQRSVALKPECDFISQALVYVPITGPWSPHWAL